MRGTISRTAQQLGQRISDLRRASSFSQAVLAERAHISGWFVSMIERGQRVPSVKTLAALASALGVPLAQLFTGASEASMEGPPPTLPLMAYLRALDLDSSDVEALLTAAKVMFGFVD